MAEYVFAKRKVEIAENKYLDIKRDRKIRFEDFADRYVVHLLDTKNGEKREISMNETVRAALIKVKKHRDSPFVFCGANGKPYGSVKKSFSTACKKAGIIKFRFHDLRHTFGSQLVMSGVDLNAVRELLGHKSLSMTLQYSQLSLDHKQRAVDILCRRMDTI